ncbi:MAG: hypothetical protein AAGL10_15130 [Pseudomonadota bacterium]
MKISDFRPISFASNTPKQSWWMHSPDATHNCAIAFRKIVHWVSISCSHTIQLRAANPCPALAGTAIATGVLALYEAMKAPTGAAFEGYLGE